MSLKHLTIGAVVVICVIVAPAAAQKNELSGMVGRTFISDKGVQGAPSYDPDLRFGKGLTFEVNYARGLMGGALASISVEVPFVVNPDEDLHAAQNLIPEKYSSYFVTPAARLNLFPQTAVSPWVSFGGGFGHFSEGSTLEFGGKNPGKIGTTTGVVQAGLGLDVKLAGRFSLRGEARDFWSGLPQLNVNTGNSRQHNVLVGVGIVWHF
jgi:Outer membrane protein beta-barrel domain